MNCCDEYGNCRQGRDCPVRQQMERRPSSWRYKLTLLGIYTISACASVSIMWLVWTGIFWVMEKMK